VAKIECAGRGDCNAKACCTSRPDTVKHICTQSDGNKDVFGVANAHDISRLPFGHEIRAAIDDFAELGFRLTTAEASDGDAWSIPSDHLLGAFFSQLEIEAALDDAEEILAFWFLVSGYAAIEPSNRSVHGFFDPLMVWRSCCNHVVELHDDVGADGVLERDGMLWGEKHGCAIVRAEEAHALFRDLGKLE
jgi:hypothetical protein